MASSPITSWQIDGETVSDFIFLASKIIADGSPPGSPIPGILQARILEWVAISFSKSRGTQISIYEPEKLRNLYQILQEVDYFHLISEFYYILILYLYFSWYVLACNSYFRKISCYHKLYICKKEHKDIFGDFWIGLELWLWWWHHGYIQKSKLINMY